MSRWVVTAALALAALVTGCASTVETAPARSATEQLLVARAADRAAETLVLPIPAGAKVFVDDSYFRAESAAYAVSAVRGSLSSAGYALSPDKAQADAVLELRAGALSLEQMRRVFGLPEMRIPINGGLNVVALPELSVYSRRDRVGVAEFSGFLYDPENGSPLGAVAPMTGEFRIRSHRLLMIVAWGQQSVEPGERDVGVSWRQF